MTDSVTDTETGTAINKPDYPPAAGAHLAAPAGAGACPTVRALMGRPPFWAALGYWVLGVALAVGAWHGYLLYPRAGLVLIGLAPFANLYFFFRGLNLLARCPAYIRTTSAARRLGLAPTWGCCAGGFLLVDELQGLWVGNGIGGRFDELARLVCWTDGHAHYVELWTDQGTRPRVRVGVGSEAELAAIGQRLQGNVARQCGHMPVLDQHDERL